jgi:membrane-bound metal-dependent hydrolase YbcI (DUF457 family)
MFIGHEAVALGAKRYAPRASLGTLFMAVQFLDLLWPVFLLLGIEHVRIDPGNTAFTPLDFYDYPYSHSLLFTLIWSVLFGVTYYLMRHDTRGAWVAGICVFSHWILDAIAHRPDLPLYPGGTVRVGLGLWNSIPATLVVEIAMFLVGLGMYMGITRAKGLAGKISLASFVAVVLAIYISVIGNPPPNERALAFTGLSAWLLVLWGYWIDRTRETYRI